MRKKAFSLIEAAIVIIVVGILIAGITISSALIKKSRIASAQAFTDKSPVNNVDDLVFWLESSYSSNLISNFSSGSGSEYISGDSLQDGQNLFSWIENRPVVDKIKVISIGDGPTYSNTINYIQSVKFDENSDSNYFRITNASFLNGGDYTIFITEKRMGSGENFILGNSANVASNRSLLIGYDSDSSIIHSQSGSAIDVDNTYYASVKNYETSIDETRIMTVVQSSSGGKSIYINGILAAKDESNIAQLSGVSTLDIGRNYNGEIGEIIIYRRALLDMERKAVEDYLGAKWKSRIIRNFDVDLGADTATDIIDCTGNTVTKNGCEI